MECLCQATENQIVAGVITIATFILTWLAPTVTSGLEGLSLMAKFSSFYQGILNSPNYTDASNNNNVCNTNNDCYEKKKLCKVKGNRHEKELKETSKAKILRNLLVTILLMLVIVALCVGLNILIDKLNIPDVDLTQEKLYSLSQESKDKIKSVKDTKIILYNMDDVKRFCVICIIEKIHILLVKF